jgi:hypothetical protein
VVEDRRPRRAIERKQATEQRGELCSVNRPDKVTGMILHFAKTFESWTIVLLVESGAGTKPLIAIGAIPLDGVDVSTDALETVMHPSN